VPVSSRHSLLDVGLGKLDDVPVVFRAYSCQCCHKLYSVSFLHFEGFEDKVWSNVCSVMQNAATAQNLCVVEVSKSLGGVELCSY
jgi:hypothetical protein